MDLNATLVDYALTTVGETCAHRLRLIRTRTG